MPNSPCKSDAKVHNKFQWLLKDVCKLLAHSIRHSKCNWVEKTREKKLLRRLREEISNGSMDQVTRLKCTRNPELRFGRRFQMTIRRQREGENMKISIPSPIKTRQKASERWVGQFVSTATRRKLLLSDERERKCGETTWKANNLMKLRSCKWLLSNCFRVEFHSNCFSAAAAVLSSFDEKSTDEALAHGN